MKRGIARREARTTHSRRGVLTEGREKGKGNFKGGRRTGLEEKGGGGRKGEEHAGGEGGKGLGFREEYARLMRRANLVRYLKREGMGWNGGKKGERRGD